MDRAQILKILIKYGNAASVKSRPDFPKVVYPSIKLIPVRGLRSFILWKLKNIISKGRYLKFPQPNVVLLHTSKPEKTRK